MNEVLPRSALNASITKGPIEPSFDDKNYPMKIHPMEHRPKDLLTTSVSSSSPKRFAEQLHWHSSRSPSRHQTSPDELRTWDNPASAC